MIRLAFLGTPAFAVPFLQALAHDPEFQVVAAISQPDKPSGRGNEIKPTPVKVAAAELGIPVLQPASLKKDPTIADTLRALGADLFVVVAYGKIIPKNILDIPRLGCVNVHPSLLPRHRGPAPMQAAIAEQDAETGVSIMLLDETMDTGPILAVSRWQLAVEETYKTLEEKVHKIGAPLLLETLKAYAAGKISPMPQSTEGVTVTRLLEREDGRADWSRPAVELDAKRRAYTPWPGLWTTWNDQRLKLVETKVASSPFEGDLPTGQAGAKEGLLHGTIHIRENRLFIGTGTVPLEILKIQPEDAKPMSASAFIAGHPDVDGSTWT